MAVVLAAFFLFLLPGGRPLFLEGADAGADAVSSPLAVSSASEPVDWLGAWSSWGPLNSSEKPSGMSSSGSSGRSGFILAALETAPCEQLELQYHQLVILLLLLLLMLLLFKLLLLLHLLLLGTVKAQAVRSPRFAMYKRLKFAQTLFRKAGRAVKKVIRNFRDHCRIIFESSNITTSFKTRTVL